MPLLIVNHKVGTRERKVTAKLLPILYPNSHKKASAKMISEYADYETSLGSKCNNSSCQPSKDDTVYLTGATGFVGGMILKICEADDSISRVYTPIRDKKGKSGEERFIDQGFHRFSKTAFISDEESIPSDVTLVILCAYDVRFHNPVDKIMKTSVTPIVKLLDQCQQAPNVRGICLVSTAYVQNPLPYKRPNGNRIPFVLREHTSASKIYNDMMNGTLSWEQVKEQYSQELSDHHKNNCYAFSKHILEHLVHEQYPSLPICVVRPSIVAPSRDGTYGHGIRAGFGLFMELARSPILRFPRNKGKLDLVFVDDVAYDIMRGASELAKPATVSESGEYFHPIYSSTSKSELPPLYLLGITAPKVKRFEIRTKTCRNILRKVERSIVTMALGKKKSRFVNSIYTNYDPAMSNIWDFEANHGEIDEIFLSEYFARFYETKQEEQPFYQRKERVKSVRVDRRWSFTSTASSPSTCEMTASS
jgi:nucleoside-diphosphate-sugar epimerase